MTKDAGPQAGDLVWVYETDIAYTWQATYGDLEVPTPRFEGIARWVRWLPTHDCDNIPIGYGADCEVAFIDTGEVLCFDSRCVHLNDPLTGRPVELP